MKNTKELNPAVNNLGNLLFRYAVKSHLNNASHINEDFDPNFIKENFDLIVLPLANFLTPYATSELLTWKRLLFNFLIKCDLPLLVVGLGAQAIDRDNSCLILKNETVDCLRLFSERSIFIGVRGYFTKSVCENFGVFNTKIIGCPSNFINPKSNLYSLLSDKYHSKYFEKIITSGDDFKFHSPHINSQRKLIQFIKEKTGSYFCQAPESLISIARNRLSEVDLSFVKEMNEILFDKSNSVDIDAFVRCHFVSVFGVDAWLEFLSIHDLYVGMRIHGAIAALQAAIPAVLVAHDSRTFELAETLGIPHLSHEEFGKYDNFLQFSNEFNFNFSSYESRRKSLYYEYCELFKINGLNVCNGIE